MTTQRVNVYTVEDNRKVWFIEEYNPAIKKWFTVGETFDKYEHASISVENHNLKEIAKTLELIPA